MTTREPEPGFARSGPSFSWYCAQYRCPGSNRKATVASGREAAHIKQSDHTRHPAGALVAHCPILAWHCAQPRRRLTVPEPAQSTKNWVRAEPMGPEPVAQSTENSRVCARLTGPQAELPATSHVRRAGPSRLAVQRTSAALVPPELHSAFCTSMIDTVIYNGTFRPRLTHTYNLCVDRAAKSWKRTDPQQVHAHA